MIQSEQGITENKEKDSLDGGVRKKMNNGHRWEDVSYHGSAILVCEFCGCHIRSAEAELECPKREEFLKKEEEVKEIKERNEYNVLKTQKDRWDYLNNKYGN